MAADSSHYPPPEPLEAAPAAAQQPADDASVAEPATEPSEATPAAASSAGPLRADARHNRDRILAAAARAYAERGLDVPMAAIARRAGVGVATLYRRFPTREALVTEVFTAQLQRCAGVVEAALADADPWRGFVTVLETVCRMQIADRGFAEAFLTAFPAAVDFEAVRLRAERGFATIVRRAQAAGRLRADFHRTDLTLVMMANCGLKHDSQAAAQAASRRLVAHLLRAFATDGSGRLPAPAPVGLYHLPVTA